MGTLLESSLSCGLALYSHLNGYKTWSAHICGLVLASTRSVVLFLYIPLPVGLQTEDIDKPQCADADADVVLVLVVVVGGVGCWLVGGIIMLPA